jgi:hypothetical protein
MFNIASKRDRGFVIGIGGDRLGLIADQEIGVGFGIKSEGHFSSHPCRIRRG